MHVTPWTVILFLSTFVVIYGQRANAQDDCRLQGTCAACIRTPNCTWCKIEINELNGKPPQRCVGKQEANLKWCDQENRVDPKSHGNLTKNRMLSSEKSQTPVQIQPQVVNLKLRLGEVYHLKVQYRQAEDYPVDLYFLVDLSRSMKYFRDHLSSLGNQIVEAMKRLTSNFRLGFGSFSDKDARPITADRPYWDGVKHYSFKHQMSLTDDYTRFKQNVIGSPITGNWDEPESGLDGVMQVIVCTEQVKWRSDARHLLVYVSDERPHIAGDGKLAGILEPNDEKCHLNKTGYYSHALLQDYPSLGQINFQARKNNINIIFATQQRYTQLYKAVSTAIEGSSVGVFDSQSTKVIELISGQYEKLVKSLKITSNSTSDILDVRFFSSCLNKDGIRKRTDQCDGIRVGLIVEFDVEIKALKCPEKKEDWHQIIQIKPEGINEDVIVNIELICDCECTKTSEERENAARPEQCHRHGILECGICSCDPGYRGDTCQCEGDQDLSNTDNSLENCRIDNSSNICSDNGKCICGSCDCNKQLNSEQHFYGKFCQCNDFSCPYSSDGKLCGEHGRCKCGECVCDSGWGGPVCACRDDESFCRPPGVNAKVCSGFGRCECGQCICDKEKRRNGRFCEDCPSCSSQRCEEFQDCVECRIHNSGKIHAEDPTCSQCPENIKSVDEIEENPDKIEPGVHVCRIAADDGSTFVFTYAYGNDDVPIILANKEKEFRAIDDFLAATLGVVLLTILLGLLILLIWKITTWMHDKKEFNKFVKDRSEAQWATGQNPLYKDAVMTFKNPAFHSEEDDDLCEQTEY